MKIDTSKIDGFADMSPEEQVEALTNYEIADNSAEVEKHYKDLISKANSEAKKYKDAMRASEEKLKSQMSEDERTKAEESERIKAIEEENARLKRDMNISKKTAFYLNLGFDGELAKETAEAFVDGDFDTVEANHLKAHEAFEKDIRADVVRNTPHPQNNTAGAGGITRQQIMAIKDTEQRQKLIAEHIELFN